jgi:peptide/nickel transport system permease protein
MMGLVRYIGRRAVYTVILLFVIVIFNFFLFQIFPFLFACPGETYNQCAMHLYLGAAPGRGNITQQLIIAQEAINKSYGFTQPIPVRFVLYIKNMFTFNFGINVGPTSGLVGNVLSTIESRAPYTILLLGASTIASFLVGIGIGVVAAARRGKVVDVSSLAILLFLQSLPVFFLGSMLMLGQVEGFHSSYVQVGVQTLHQGGLGYLAGLLNAFFLPFLTLTIVGIGGVFLTQRAVMIDTMGEDYILMARAKGLPERTVLYKHAFRNAVLPIATAFALSLGFILSGAVVTETVFSWPGLGQAIYAGVIGVDFPLEQAMFFIITLMVLICVFIVDCTYGFLDPRVSTG